MNAEHHRYAIRCLHARQTWNSIETLRNDPKAIEHLAREKFSYAKPGETVIRFESPATNSVLR